MDIKTAGQSGTASVSIFTFRQGILIAGGILIFALVKADFSLAFAAAGVLLVSFTVELWRRLASARIDFTMKPDRERLFPGEALVLDLEIANDKFLPVWVNLELPSPLHLEAEGAAEEGCLRSGLRLLSWEKSHRPWRLVAKRRGVSPLGPALISAGDLLGLRLQTKSCACPGEIIVFPRRLRMLPLDLPFQEFFGTHTARGPVDDPVWYEGTRDYTGTQPAKNIHWKASARLGVLLEKLCEPTYDRKVLFVFDAKSYSSLPVKDDGEFFDTSAWREKALREFERMLETLGTLAAALMETGAAFGLVSGAAGSQRTAAVLPAGRGPEQLGLLLEILARAEAPPANEEEAAAYENSQRPQRLGAALSEASRAYTGLVYFGIGPGAGARSVLRETGRRKKVLFVFSREADLFFEGHPACLAEDICFAEEEAK